MPSNSSLGIYIEENLIKYAKVVKEKDSLKVEAFNIVFYDNLGEAINRIISETYSSKIPICINVSNELYNYYDMFYSDEYSDYASWRSYMSKHGSVAPLLERYLQRFNYTLNFEFAHTCSSTTPAGF